ncbi:hypothetical protein SAMN04487897_109145 [Paenibacillus sp. yr247]|uniref:hypothetical protein n=1 Tax=Paenibacillus sp. yr247 TaxID=1761880 RepID=UPI00088AA035|nr:hypothetical protein [Paenibacillus sp. yr247]SDO18672.1 hypothetical protein SAMN04487897_109145 [Paenibacillus sp. yr247]
MLITLLGAIASAFLFLTLWQKAKADISFLESKAVSFGERETTMLREIEWLNQQLSLQGVRSNPTVTQPQSSHLHEFEALDRWDIGETVPVKPPDELQVAALNDVSMLFLTKLGVNTANEVIPEGETLLQTETGEFDIPFVEEPELEQGSWFPESEVTMLTASSLDKPGLHFFEGEIIQKFGEDFAMVSNGEHSYHLSHAKFTRHQPGDKISIQVLVSPSGARETIAVWPQQQALISA